MTMLLETTRLVLRPYQPSDLDGMAEMFGDDEVTAHTLLGKRTRDQTAAVLDSYVRYFGERGYGMLAVTDAEDGAYLGECGLFDSPTGDGRLYLRYALHRAAWGKGYAHEAAAAVVADTFSNLSQDWLMAGVTPDNHGSLRVIKKLGFRYTRVVAVHGMDFKLFELSRAEFGVQRTRAVNDGDRPAGRSGQVD